jgi:predicted metal-dependent HD superfamily phosphohydrolase
MLEIDWCCRQWLRRIVIAYNEPHRKYHTQRHLEKCLGLLDKHWKLAAEPANIEAALWFHDAIYNVKENDNETQSAEWAAFELQQASVDPERIEKIKGHILATRHAALPQGQDQMLLVDIDLSILGASWTRFEEYERQVREEYGWVPDYAFCRKRREVLSAFLSRDFIYSTSELRAVLETQARANLAFSLKQLGG